jgi:hypothetical protein
VGRTAAQRPPGPSNPVVAIFWISALGLFLELLLIRWIGTEVRIFAYLQNTILVVCFLGLGVGLFSGRRRVSFNLAIWPLVALVGLLALPLTRAPVQGISGYLSAMGDLNIWWYGGGGDGFWGTVARFSLALALTFLVMLLVAVAFIPIGRALGFLMDEHPQPILAYSVNVMGSLAGIWLFVLLSRMHQPPALWFGVLGVLFLPFFARRRTSRKQLILLVFLPLLVALAGYWDKAEEVVWSPYQKLALIRNSDQVITRRHTLQVNNAGYQVLLDLRPETVARVPEHRKPPSSVSQYDLPFLLHPEPSAALLVGAGSGNDAAGALRQGVERITAVEIDPAIIRFGRRYHPERPYDSGRVRVVTDDARSFFARTAETYDVVVFGLLDSHTTTSMTNARLDHYVYTRESFRQATALLRPGGILFLSFEAEKPFIADRMARTLRDVFGEDPLVFKIPTTDLGWGGVVFVTGDLQRVRDHIARTPDLAELIRSFRESDPVQLSYSTRLAEDDWPYIYLEEPGIPSLYFLLAGLLGILLFIVTRRFGVPGLNPARWDRSNWHFFFLGAAFLLLEVQNISKASVVLGNTWLVNAVIISGVLSMVLLANLIAKVRPRLPLMPVYVALLASALALYLVDLARFASLPYGVKAPVVGALTTLPMVFSGIVFVRSFAIASRKDLALGANLLGALAGALLESVSFWLGIRALLLLVSAFYALAWLTSPGQRVLARTPRSVPVRFGACTVPLGEGNP